MGFGELNDDDLGGKGLLRGCSWAGTEACECESHRRWILEN
jgi:hypothetical protein